MTPDLPQSSNGGSRPIPDPTLLTDAAIAKAMTALRDWAAGQFEVRDERLSAMDEATKLRQRGSESISREIDDSVGHLKELTDERFSAAERLRVEQKKDTKDAVDAALSAAKEAVKEQTTASERSIAKSETATREQLKQQQETFATAIEGLRRSIDDLKERAADDARNLRQSIGDVATTANGTVQQKAGAKDDRNAVYAAIGIVLAIAAFVAGKGGL